jgi:hypothetical protein
MKVHLLDTSALTDLSETADAIVRHRVLDEISADRIVVLGTYPLMWELYGTRAVNEPKFRRQVDLLLRMTRGRLLLDAPARRVRELQAGGPLTYPGFVDDKWQLVPTAEAEQVDTAAAHGEGVKFGLIFRELEMAHDSIRELDRVSPGWRKELTGAYRSGRYATELGEIYGQIGMKLFEARAGVDASQLTASTLPTFWSSALIHVARIYAVIVGGTSPKGRRSAGQFDLMHLEEAASYANVFVTSDASLRSFAKKVRDLRCEVLSFEDWAARLTK